MRLQLGRETSDTGQALKRRGVWSWWPWRLLKEGKIALGQLDHNQSFGASWSDQVSDSETLLSVGWATDALTFPLRSPRQKNQVPPSDSWTSPEAPWVVVMLADVGAARCAKGRKSRWRQ
jgi:hypothetical protein